jgi:hypothetical protein
MNDRRKMSRVWSLDDVVRMERFPSLGLPLVFIDTTR